VERAKAGDPQAITELDRALRGPLRGFLRNRLGNSELAEDHAQLTLITVFEKLHTLENARDVSTWAHTIALNKVRDSKRKEADRPEEISITSDDNYRDPVAREVSAAESETTRANVESLWRELGLSREAAELYVMKELEQRSWDEVERLLKTPREELTKQLISTKSQVARVKEKAKVLSDKIATLPKDQAQVLELVELQGLPLEEAAKKMKKGNFATVLLLSEARKAVFAELMGGRWVENDLRFVPPQFREAARLISVEGLSYEETAERLSIPVNTVKTRVFRARQAVDFARQHLPQYIDLGRGEIMPLAAQLYWIDGYDVNRISEILGSDVGTVKSSLSHMRRRFAAQYHRDAVREGTASSRQASFPFHLHAYDMKPVKLTEQEKQLPRPQFDELAGLGWNEEQLRTEAEAFFSEQDRRIFDLVVFKGMNRREVHRETGLDVDHVTTRLHWMMEHFRPLDPNNLLPSRLRQDQTGAGLRTAIGWGTKVTDAKTVEDVIENLVEQLAESNMKEAARAIYLHELSLEEAGKQLNLDPKTVKSSLQNARDRMSELNYDPELIQRRDERRADLFIKIEETLPPEQWQVAKLLFVDEKPQRVVAEKTGLTVAQVKGQRRRLGEKLGVGGE